ncbi:MAG: type IV secretory system conjugative DNA transfer family protein [Ruminiclostridium sp.]|nr:type IV secretory system conjugative DNA transfer family protein [Ruminiclostridium sp.]
MNKKVIIAGLLTLYAGLSVFVAGIFVQALKQYGQWLKDGAHGMYHLSISLQPRELLSHFGSKPGIVILLGLLALAVYLYLIYRNRPTQDGRNFDISQEGTYGTAGWMSMKEAKNVLEISDISSQKGIVLGRLGSETVALPHDTLNNKHIAVYGASGSMKSRAFVRNNILQLAKLGKSMILTDPKGELFSDTAQFLRDIGYTVRLFNLVQPELSDRWNCLAEINGNELMAQTFADVVIANTNTGAKMGGDPFWDRAEMNLLKALALFVDCKKGQENKTMKQLYALLASGSNASLDEIFTALPITHPALAPYNIYKQASENVRTGVVIGLGTRLQVFQNALIQRMTSATDIGLTLPAHEKCAYFCIMSDQDSTLDFLSSLFFSFLFIKLVRYADSHGGKCNPEVYFLLDEFPNIGCIPDFTKKISTIRSRALHCFIIFQNIPQLSDRYPLNKWQEILGNCDTQLFLGCTDIVTAEHVSKVCGQVTINLESFQRRCGPPGYLDLGKKTMSVGKRFLLNPDEVLRLPRDDALVIVRGQKPLKIQKMDYTLHPMCQQLKPFPVSQYQPVWKCEKDKTPDKPPPQKTQNTALFQCSPKASVEKPALLNTESTTSKAAEPVGIKSSNSKIKETNGHDF